MPNGRMKFFAFGLNHETASVEVAESFALEADAQHSLYHTLDLGPDAELILLSTCNRTEAYLWSEAEDVRRVQTALAEVAGQSWPEEASFLLQDEAAVQHVLEVTGGLRSLVLGDGQILAQMKEAYRRAVEANAVDTLLHRLMHTAFRAAKRVASETALSSGAASVSSAAVAMARDHFRTNGHEALEGANVVLVGAGKMGRLALNAMCSYAPAALTVTNRSPERARAVAVEYDADTVSWAQRHTVLTDADVVIVATGASEPVLTLEAVPERPARRPPTLLIDISMPRNVDPRIDGRAGYTVCDLDALRAWTDDVEVQRSAEVPEARAICTELVGDFVTWVFHQQALQPAIQAIRNTFEAIRTQEIERHHHRLTEVDKEELDELTRSIMQKLLAVPIVRLKNVDPDSIDFMHGIELLRLLFARPSCEDDAAQASERMNAEADVQPRLSDIPPQCPFDEMPAEDEEDEEALLRRILRDLSRNESSGA